MATGTFVHECRIFAVGLQISASPAGPTPTICAPELIRALSHHLYLPELARHNEPIRPLLLEPGNFREARSVWPRMNVAFPSRLYRDVISENEAELPIVAAIRYSE
jgi:hypothetical protein